MNSTQSIWCARFATNYVNSREQAEVPGLVQYTNVASIDNFGWNGGWEGSSLARRMRFGLNVTGAFTRLNQGDGPVPPVVAPQIFGNAHVSYAFGEDLPTVALAVSAMGPRPADRTAPDGTRLPDAVPVADFHGSLTGRVPKVPGLSYVLAGDYVTATHGAYSAGPYYQASTAQFLQATSSVLPPPGFAPIDQVRVMVGLRLDLFTQSSSGAGAAE